MKTTPLVLLSHSQKQLRNGNNPLFVQMMTCITPCSGPPGGFCLCVWRVTGYVSGSKSGTLQSKHFQSEQNKSKKVALSYRFVFLEGLGLHKMKIIKNIVLICAISLFSKFAAAQGYTAILSCGFNGSHINIAACFLDTDLKLTNNGQTAIYKAYNIGQVGNEYSDGLHINLSESFRLTAQNSQDNLVLGIVIKNSNGQVVYQDVVGRFGVIKVGN